jgi:hypothetical protein
VLIPFESTSVAFALAERSDLMMNDGMADMDEWKFCHWDYGGVEQLFCRGILLRTGCHLNLSWCPYVVDSFSGLEVGLGKTRGRFREIFDCATPHKQNYLAGGIRHNSSI